MVGGYVSIAASRKGYRGYVVFRGSYKDYRGTYRA